MTGALVHHLARRGLQQVHQHFTKEQYISQLEQDAQLYENAPPEMEIKPQEMLPLLITAIIALLLVISINYTIGHVMVALASIESTTRTTTIIASKPPPYNEEPDAPLEKEPLLTEDVGADTDVEVTVVEYKPITSKITTTIGHLQRIGGFGARWRGLGLSALYHLVHGMFNNILAQFLGLGLIGESLSYIFVSVGLARLHMAWTHKMVSYPSSKSWIARMPARKDCKALLLPALVHAVAQQATVLLPIGMAILIGLPKPSGHHGPPAHHDGHMHHVRDVMEGDCHAMGIMALRVLAVPVTYLLVAFTFLLPASVTLTRIEAALLPEGEETIVSFDKAEMLREIDTSSRGGCRALFAQAWRSFDRSARARVVKTYVKMVLAQLAVIFTAVHIMVAEIFIIGGDRLGIFFKSAAAQVKLMAIEANEN